MTGVDVDSSMMERVAGTCPEVMARLGTVDVRCLIDTGRRYPPSPKTASKSTSDHDEHEHVSM